MSERSALNKLLPPLSWGSREHCGMRAESRQDPKGREKDSQTLASRHDLTNVIQNSQQPQVFTLGLHELGFNGQSCMEEGIRTPPPLTLERLDIIGSVRGSTIVFSFVHNGEPTRNQWIVPIIRLHRWPWSDSEGHPHSKKTWGSSWGALERVFPGVPESSAPAPKNEYIGQADGRHWLNAVVAA